MKQGFRAMMRKTKKMKKKIDLSYRIKLLITRIYLGRVGQSTNRRLCTLLVKCTVFLFMLLKLRMSLILFL